MNLEQVIERLTYLRDTGYASGFEEVIVEEEHPRGEGLAYDIVDIETDGGQIKVKVS